EHARWVVEALVHGDGVTGIVPGGFEAYARILHPLADGQRWADVAPMFLGPGDASYDWPYADPLLAVEGNLGEEAVDALADALTPWAPDGCHFGLWDGWGWLHAGSSLVFVAVETDDGEDSETVARAQAEAERHHDEATRGVWSFVEPCPLTDDVGGGRPMLLFDGPIGAVRTIGYHLVDNAPLSRQSPQWWWPPDRSWFVATEIDYPWTYLAGPEALVGEVLAALPTESTRISPTARW
ncbi:MAG TPA: hypothetical protein VIL36_03425, partial [Acidimicrobiales bacterium]